jgi:murein DD-endopeptidase MepM/ murein hydrolase activator NlpD
MSVPETPGVALPSSFRALASSTGAGEDPARVRELAHQFESLFIAQMLRQMRQSMTMMGDEDEQGDGAKTFGPMSDTIDSELARQLSEAGGMGIADVIIESFQRQAQGALGQPLDPGGLRSLTTPPAVAVPLAKAPVPVAAAVPLPAGQTVTSAFGWRPDPFTGKGRFHKGVDVRAAYGQQIPAVANGKVVSAGPAGGYGLSVVIEHGSGIRTRYAHLSEVSVKAGDVVERGQDIGRVGQSGRSTGPHLHFEVLADGRPVDPVQAAARFRVLGELKEVETGADSVNGWPSAESAAEE